MAIAATGVALWEDNRVIRAIATLVLSGSYAAGGEAFDPLTQSYTPGTTRLAFSVIRSLGGKAPIAVDINGINGWIYGYDFTNKKILIRGQQPTDATAGIIPLAQLANGAYPATVTSDVITVEITIPKV